MKLRRVAPCEGQTDMTKLIVTFRNSANALKNLRSCTSVPPCVFVIESRDKFTSFEVVRRRNSTLSTRVIVIEGKERL